MTSIPRTRHPAHRGPRPIRLASLALALLAGASSAQEAPLRGIRTVDPRWHALVNATLVPRPGERIENATIVMRDGLFVSVESGAAPPEGARVFDAKGLFVYPGLVEPHVSVEAPRPAGEARGNHWLHELVTPQRSALDGPGLTAAQRKELRSLGFTAAAIAPSGGVFRGLGAVVSLGEPGDELSSASAEVLARDVFQEIGFQTAGFRGRGAAGPTYPTSEMGAIALLRQTFLDAQRYERMEEIYAHGQSGHEPPQSSAAMEALGRGTNGGIPLLFDARNELQVLRAAELARESGRPMILLGCGTEFRRLDAIARTSLPIVLPLAYPEEPDVSTHAKAEGYSLRDLMSWEQAPTNPRRLVAAGLSVALTSDKLSERGEFRERLRRAIVHGLSEADALAMMTIVPARLLGLEGRVGAVAPGMIASLVVTDGELFAKDTKIRDVWVGGRRYEVEAAPAPDRAGSYELHIARLGEEREIAGRLELGKDAKLKLRVGERELEGRGVERTATHLHFLLEGKELGVQGALAFSGLFDGEELHGSVALPDGSLERWYARLSPAPQEHAQEAASQEAASEQVASAEQDAAEPQARSKEEQQGEKADEKADARPEAAAEREAKRAAAVPERYGIPFGAYGLDAPPPQEPLVVRHATIWTAGPAGILENATLVVENGRVRYVGPAEGAPALPGARSIDAAGKHLTPGLIDCHSHTGISGGVNEMGRRVTAEVRIGDVVDPDDIGFYRQLAGGLTAANQLHGSGNAIGGQNSVVKLRWGVASPREMLVEGAKPGIKFALGENPKRVATQTEVPDEYPRTRMGIEALIRDRLNAGREYRRAWERYEALSAWEKRTSMPPRRDLELEALAEITAGERLVHCHSYRQDEILMLARLAQEFGFRIGTYQHVLEGYKVAEAVRDSALGASTFSDWWAYKFEVIDAIPHNAAIMSEVGVVVSINSDSDEHARRLNTEAAKAVKHGGMQPHEALKLVTLNPAIQLGLADRMGSLEPGKDADFVIWSGDPLSYRSRCEATFIEGREFFSLERDRALREEAERERQRILQVLRDEGGGSGAARRRGGRARPADPTAPSGLDEHDHELDHELELLWRSGIDPALARPGDCGCNERTYGLEAESRR